MLLAPQLYTLEPDPKHVLLGQPSEWHALTAPSASFSATFYHTLIGRASATFFATHPPPLTPIGTYKYIGSFQLRALLADSVRSIISSTPATAACLLLRCTGSLSRLALS